MKKGLLYLLLIMVVTYSGCKEDSTPTQTDSKGSIQGKVVDLESNPIPTATVQTTPATSSVFSNQSGEYTISDVSPGTYQVSATKTGYTGSSVSVTVSVGKTTTANIQLTSSGGTAPSAPTLSSPSNGATGVGIPPTLSWNSSTGAASYTLQVSTSNSFSSYVYNQSGLTGTSQQVSGLSNSTTYYWRVSATNSYGTSAYSSVRSFTTAAGGTAPSAPTLSSPSNGATGVGIPPTLSWNASTGAVSYTLQVSTSNSFSSYVYNQNGLTGTSQQVSGLSNSTTYYWRVSSTNSYGTSSYSSVWSFTTASGGGGGSSCVGVPTVTYEGKTYNTVQIGAQCWLKENLNVGTRINGNTNASNNGTIEKYCYDDNEANCNTYGGLYQWNEAMQYSTTPGTRGICPPGWHIPTKAEFDSLEAAVNNDGNALKAIGQGTGSGTGTNTSGFSALLAG
ncbi:MAG: carboxypeptidase regulatory-like domain-containing protein, partial [Ignavibacteriaceae bacterium]|nr:carboxypeptidase regulatory-like domain-containing protein [Ignavibacteriaceae bacterium]